MIWRYSTDVYTDMHFNTCHMFVWCSYHWRLGEELSAVRSLLRTVASPMPEVKESTLVGKLLF